MNEMRKLMESIRQINEGWDPKLIAGAIFDEAELEGSPLKRAAENSPEPYRAMIYEFGNLTGMYNAEALDGSEIYHEIVDELERLSVEEDQYHNPIEEEGDDIRYDPQPGDDEPLEYDDTPGAKKYTRQYGSVTVKVDEGEVLITHGYGENIFLSMEEWKEFAGEIQDILL